MTSIRIIHYLQIRTQYLLNGGLFSYFVRNSENLLHGMKSSLLRIIVKATPLCIICLILVKLIIINEFAGIGEKVKSLDARLVQVQEENEILTRRYASASSLLTISIKAEQASYRTPTKDQFLSLPIDQFSVAVAHLQ